MAASSYEVPQQELVAPGARDIEAELVVNRLVDRPDDRVGRGEQAQHPRVECGPRRLAGAPRPVEVEHEVQQRLGRHDQHEGRVAPDDPAHHDLLLGVVAEEFEHAADAEGEQDDRVADHDAGAAAQVRPRWLDGHAREEPREDEREQRDAERDRKLPAERGRDAEGAVVGVGVAFLAHPPVDADGEAHEEQRVQHAQRGHHVRVHLAQALARHAGVIGGEQAPTLVEAGPALHLQALQPLEAVLVEDQDQAEPHHEPREGPRRGDDRARVLGRLAEDEERERDRKLGEQARGGDARGPLIGMVIDTHRWLQQRSGRTVCPRGRRVGSAQRGRGRNDPHRQGSDGRVGTVRYA